jgi:hypothetical protein
MKTFRLVPTRPGPHWGLTPNRGEILVKARTSGEARAIAAAEESGSSAPNRRSDTSASAFRDPKLYSVRQVRDPLR